MVNILIVLMSMLYLPTKNIADMREKGLNDAELV